MRLNAPARKLVACACLRVIDPVLLVCVVAPNLDKSALFIMVTEICSIRDTHVSSYILQHALLLIENFDGCCFYHVIGLV